MSILISNTNTYIKYNIYIILQVTVEQYEKWFLIDFLSKKKTLTMCYNDQEFN